MPLNNFRHTVCHSCGKWLKTIQCKPSKDNYSTTKDKLESFIEKEMHFETISEISQTTNLNITWPLIRETPKINNKIKDTL